MLAQESSPKQVQSLPPVLFNQGQLKEKNKSLGILPPLLFSQDPGTRKQLRTYTGNLFSTPDHSRRGLKNKSLSSSSDSEDDDNLKTLTVTGTMFSKFDHDKERHTGTSFTAPRDFGQDLNYRFYGQPGNTRGVLTSLSGSHFLQRPDADHDSGTLFAPRQYSHETRKSRVDTNSLRQSKSVPGTAMYRMSQESQLNDLNESQLKSLQGALFSLITSVACPSVAIGSAPSSLTMSTSQHLKIHYGTSNMRCLRADRGRDRVEEQLVHPPKLTMHTNKEPTFYIGGGNGVGLINDAMEEIGWRRIKEKTDDNFKLKWCELKTAINYGTFKEGDQMVNHIPNCQLLTNKMGLLNSLTEYEKWLQSNTKKGRGVGRVKLADFIPETYKLDDPKDREMFFNIFKEGEWWICKPTGRNQGKGIFITKDVNEIKQLVQEHEGEPGRPSKPINRVIQRYIKNPLLLDKRKFDIRAYMLIANMIPYLVLYHKGYVRLSLNEYDNDCGNLVTHLTNQFIQKKDPLYKENKEDTAWSMDRFNDYINEHVAAMKGLPDDWVFNVLEKRMRDCMLYSFNAVKNKLQAKCGFFDLYGYDFMVDEDMNVSLIEVNINPCLATNCEALKDVVPYMVKEALYISIECFEKARKNKPLLPLQTLNRFEIIFNASKTPAPKRSNSKSPVRNVTTTQRNGKTEEPVRSRSVSPQRRPRSLSPLKEAGKTGTAPVATVSAAGDGDSKDSNPKLIKNSTSEGVKVEAKVEAKVQIEVKKTGKEHVGKENNGKETSKELSPKRVVSRRDWLPGATAVSSTSATQNPRQVPSKMSATTSATTSASQRPRTMTSSTSTIDPSLATTSPYAAKVSDNIRLRMSHSSTAISPIKRTRSKARARKDEVTSGEKDTSDGSRRQDIPNRGS